jgi:hypothetical protein
MLWVSSPAESLCMTHLDCLLEMDRIRKHKKKVLKGEEITTGYDAMFLLDDATEINGKQVSEKELGWGL